MRFDMRIAPISATSSSKGIGMADSMERDVRALTEKGEMVVSLSVWYNALRMP